MAERKQKEAEVVAEELRKKEEEDKLREELDREINQNDLVYPPATSGGHITPFTPSKKHTVACLDTIFFYRTRKTITRRSEKGLKMGSQVDVVTVTENTIMEGTHKKPKFMASVNVAVSQASADNVVQLMENVEHQKEKMLKLKDTLVKTRGEGIELKRKHEAILP